MKKETSSQKEKLEGRPLLGDVFVRVWIYSFIHSVGIYMRYKRNQTIQTPLLL